MRANPGGQLDPGDVVGRDSLVRDMWRVLDRQSVLLCAERRMGKTTVIRKMQADPPDGQVVVYRDLEGIRSPLEFTESVFRDVEEYLGRWQRTSLRARGLISHLSGTEIAGILRLPDVVAPHWRPLLANTIEDLMEHQQGRVLFLWDEVPLMLANIQRSEPGGNETAMEILDTLRFLRQTHRDLRMVFTGSIGLHHIVRSLRRLGYANAPANDMCAVDLLPLSDSDARLLASRLLEGEDIRCDDRATLAQAIGPAVDNVAYFIQHVVDEMARRGEIATPTGVLKIVRACLVDAQDRWQLRYYFERIQTYYDEAERPVALGLLDALGASDTPLPFETLFNRLKHVLVTEDAEGAREILTLLERDHYIAQDTEGGFRFRYRLIQQWWNLHRGGGL